MSQYRCYLCSKLFRRTEKGIIRHTSKPMCDDCTDAFKLHILLKKVQLALKKALYWLDFLGPKKIRFVNDRIKAVRYITKIQKELDNYLDGYQK